MLLESVFVGVVVLFVGILRVLRGGVVRVTLVICSGDRFERLLVTWVLFYFFIFLFFIFIFYLFDVIIINI